MYILKYREMRSWHCLHQSWSFMLILYTFSSLIPIMTFLLLILGDNRRNLRSRTSRLVCIIGFRVCISISLSNNIRIISSPLVVDVACTLASSSGHKGPLVQLPPISRYFLHAFPIRVCVTCCMGFVTLYTVAILTTFKIYGMKALVFHRRWYSNKINQKYKWFLEV